MTRQLSMQSYTCCWKQPFVSVIYSLHAETKAMHFHSISPVNLVQQVNSHADQCRDLTHTLSTPWADLLMLKYHVYQSTSCLWSKPSALDPPEKCWICQTTLQSNAWEPRVLQHEQKITLRINHIDKASYVFEVTFWLEVWMQRIHLFDLPLTLPHASHHLTWDFPNYLQSCWRTADTLLRAAVTFPIRCHQQASSTGKQWQGFVFTCFSDRRRPVCLLGKYRRMLPSSLALFLHLMCCRMADTVGILSL